jgi:hypothetical protein
MDLKEHKTEIKKSMKEFIKKMTEEHGCSAENAKTILISEAMDSVYEIETEVR